MLKLERLPDWDRQLAKMTEKHLAEPFSWGQSDCLLAAADAVLAVTGFDPAEDIRGKYDTALGAIRLMKKRKSANVEEVLMKLFPQIKKKLTAQRGDLVTINEGDQAVAGYITTQGVFVRQENGNVFLPQTSIKMAFKVG